jgi:hypothetical protein
MVLDSGATRTFFRITRSNPPTLNDFLSNTARRRRPPRRDARTLRLWDGVSVFDTEDSARRQAQRIPAIGGYIAAVQFPAAGPVHYEQTGNDPHHYTVWADAVYFLAQVTSVSPV